MAIRYDIPVLLRHCNTNETLWVRGVIGNPFFGPNNTRRPNQSDITRRDEYGQIMSYKIIASNICNPLLSQGMAYGQPRIIIGDKYDILQVNPNVTITAGSSPLPKVFLAGQPACVRTPVRTPRYNPRGLTPRLGGGLSDRRMNRYKRF